MVLVQKWPFFQHFYLGNLGQENVFYDILKRKRAFVGYKNKKFKKSKKLTFSKGVNPWFWSKNSHYPNFFFDQLQTRKMYSVIFQNEKTPFQAIETRSSKSRKIDIFGPKMAIFRNFFFDATKARKKSFMIFQKVERPFQAIKTRN